MPASWNQTVFPNRFTFVEQGYYLHWCTSMNVWKWCWGLCTRYLRLKVHINILVPYRATGLKKDRGSSLRWLLVNLALFSSILNVLHLTQYKWSGTRPLNTKVITHYYHYAITLAPTSSQCHDYEMNAVLSRAFRFSFLRSVISKAKKSKHLGCRLTSRNDGRLQIGNSRPQTTSAKARKV